MLALKYPDCFINVQEFVFSGILAEMSIYLSKKATATSMHIKLWWLLFKKQLSLEILVLIKTTCVNLQVILSYCAQHLPGRFTPDTYEAMSYSPCKNTPISHGNTNSALHFDSWGEQAL